MILQRIFFNDLKRKKTINVVLGFFVVLASLLIVTSSNMLLELNGALRNFFHQADTPHFVQMHEGVISQPALTEWSAQNHLVKAMQIVSAIKIDDAYLAMGNRDHSEKNSVMNLYFEIQNKGFDFLPDLNGKIIYPAAGEILAPIYFMVKYKLKIGDKIQIHKSGFNKQITIIGFVRDVQMNPALVHSKRFIINPTDFKALLQAFQQDVYFIEFKLNDTSLLKDFSRAYQLSSMPQNGPTLDYHLFMLLNALSDGIVIGVLTLVAIMLVLISLLCLRLIILATVEEDFREVGVMKAIGMQLKNIKMIYIVKYVFLVGIACFMGYLLAFILNSLFVKNILLYLGSLPRSMEIYIISFTASAFVFLVIMNFCLLVFRRFNKISPVAAFKERIFDKSTPAQNSLKLPININILLGLKDIVQQYKMFLLLFFVFASCVFIIILPLNFLNTLKSDDFITYMGIGRSDARIDLNREQSNRNLANTLIQTIGNDKNVTRYALLTTGRFKFIGQNDKTEIINIETGDINAFPLKYLQGRSPTKQNEIALSYLSSKQFNKSVGSHLDLLTNNSRENLLVTGIYQDVTNGGRTAKALLKVEPAQRLWQVINIEFKPGIDTQAELDTYTKHFSPIKVVYLNDYLKQTLGGLINSLNFIFSISVIIALVLSILITSLFLKMLLAKQATEIAIMKILGFKPSDISIQYLTRALIVLNLGLIIGVFLANTLGQMLVSLLWSLMGAARIDFAIKPMQVYVLYPLLLMGTVSITCLLNLMIFKKINITDMIME